MLLALLLLTRAAAEWVEISQQHYRKPAKLTTLEPTSVFQDAQNTRNTYVAPTRETYSNQNVENPVKIHRGQDLREPTRTYDVFRQHPVRGEFATYDRPPPTSSHVDREVNPVRMNPFLQEDVTLQSPIMKPYFDRDSQSPTRATYLHKKLESPTKETYFNQSIIEHKWNQNIHRVGNRRGEQVPTTVPSFDNWNDKTYRPDNERDRKDEIKHIADVSNVRIKDETVSGKVERVSNIGNIKRVELANTPVKSPTLNNKTPERTPDRRNNINPYKGQNYDSLSDELDIETNFFNSQEHSRKPSNNLKQGHITEKVVTHVDNGKIKKSNYENKVSTPNLQRQNSTHKPDKKNSRPDQDSVLGNIETTIDPKVENKIGTAITLVKPQEEFTTNKNAFLDFVAKKDKPIDSPKERNKNNAERDENRGSVKIEKVHKVEKVSSSEKGEATSSSGEVKVNTMENVLKFMKLVADTISKNTRRGANGKITYLNDLKHTLLDNIKDRIDATWPDDDTPASRRHSRSASPRGHVEFPSSESALMTISFLTFAVFLIKLVLQVIQTYKHKTMLMAPLMVATAGRTISNKLHSN